VLDQNPNCERWMWIELIGFENEQADHNVPAFLENCGFVPEGLCLLFSTPDFFHTHVGFEREVVFPPDYCSYGGKPYNAERPRQPWTNHQLKSLVAELHKHGIKVFPTLFNIFMSEIDGELYQSPWCLAHPELWEVLRDGQASPCLNPLKRLTGGSYYEDLLIKDLSRVVRNYDFDGVHNADGYSSSRHPIWMVDYSDDMVEQFVTMMGVELPFPIVGGPSNPEHSTARATHIWQNLRHEWCEFYARRNSQLLTKVCGAMHDTGGEVIYNNAWTRDPFEAYYRYGVDYRRVAKAGVDRFIMETVGAGVSIGAESGYQADLRFDMNIVLGFTKACLPDMPLSCLNATGDTTENWDLLNHAPAVSEREIYTLGHVFVQKPEGLIHASAGPFVCLADGITQTQWKWLRENWVTAYNRSPQRPLGATVLWSEAALDAEFAEYSAHRLLPRLKVASELQKRGAPIQTVVNSVDLAAAQGCLLVPKPELLPADELRQLLDYQGGPVMMIGRQSFELPVADVTFAEGPGPEQLCCRVYGTSLQTPTPTANTQSELPEDMPEPPHYLQQLYFRPASEEFLQTCADLLIELSDAPRIVGAATDLRVLSCELDDSTIRVLVGNESHYYVLGQLDVRRVVKKIHIASHYPGRPLLPNGQLIHIQVPPRGMIVLDIELA